MRHSILPLLLGLVVTQVARSQETSPGEIATLKLGDRQDASLVAFSPDGRLLASAGRGADIRIWDVTTARRLYTLKGHSASAITFSPDGKLLASAETRSGVLLWDVQSGKQQGKLEVPRDRGWIRHIYCLAFRPDGKTLVGAGTVSNLGENDCTALISWDAGTGKMIEFDKLDKVGTNWLWLSADGGTVAYFASTERKFFLRVRDLANKKKFEFDLSSKESIFDKNKHAASHCHVLKLQLGVTKNKGAATLLDQVNHRMEWGLFRVVIAAQSLQHEALRNKVVSKSAVGGLEFGSDDCWATNEDLHGSPLSRKGLRCVLPPNLLFNMPQPDNTGRPKR